ncbi:hypothetical protein I317_03745 [Kwoniella heveanensis CBS 569]|nr:hypothetical protein I317_03745 [Kwoniella heveanensis CBS 569]
MARRRYGSGKMGLLSFVHFISSALKRMVQHRLHVDEGEHILEPIVPGYIFQPLLVTVTPQTSSPSNEIDQSPSSDTTASNSHSNDAKIPSSPITPTFSIHVQTYNPTRKALPPTTASLAHPLILSAVGKEDYFMPKGGMNILGMLKNPMVLMMLFSGIMMYALPKLTASMADMDPEMAKEMAETRKKMQGVQNMDWAGSLSTMLAGSSDSPTSAPGLASPATNAGVSLGPSAAGGSGSSTPNRGGGGGGGTGGRGSKNRRR